MSDVKVKKTELVHNGFPYFRTLAMSQSICAVGEIRKPITGGNFVDVKDQITVDKIGIKKIGPLKIDFAKTSKTDFGANISLAKVFGLASVDAAFEALRKDELELFYVEANVDDVVREINRSPNIKEDLRRWGNSARVILGGFVVMKAKTNETFGSSTDAEANITVKGVTISPKVSNRTNGSSSVSYPPGAYFGYMPARLRWDHKNEKKATKVVDLDRDRHGL